MARPTKDGINYFPMDVGFLQDKKVRLIKGEFGAKGVLVLLQLLCSIYGENGYFKQWDEDDCLLMSEGVDGDAPAQLIQEVVQGCVRRSIFDDRVYDVFGVLTSRGIQRRYLRAVSTYENIDIYEEYWLLNIDDKKDVPAGISKKITFKKVSLKNNPNKIQINPVNLQNNPPKEKKENKKKEKEILYPPYPLTEFCFSPELEGKIHDWLTYKTERKEPYKPVGFKSLLTTIKKRADQYGDQAVIDLIDECMGANWKGIIWDRIKPAGTPKPKENPFDELLRKELRSGQNRNDSADEDNKRLLPDVLQGRRPE